MAVSYKEHNHVKTPEGSLEDTTACWEVSERRQTREATSSRHMQEWMRFGRPHATSGGLL